MKNKLFARSAMLTAILAILFASRVALAVDEVEPNDPYSSPTGPQALTVDSAGTVTVTNASILNTLTHRDYDLYSFYATGGDVVTFNIDGGMDANFNGILTVLAVWGPTPLSGNLPLIQQTGADTGQPDAGSPTTADARITDFHIPASGTYIVGVSTDPGQFTDINTLVTTALSPMHWSPDYNVVGSYTLTISGVTPYSAPAPTPTPTPTPPPPVATVLSINIDIMPGRNNVLWLQTANANQTGADSDADHGRDIAKEIHRHFKGGIPVALLSSDTFNPMDVDQSQLYFGKSGTENSLIRCNPHGIDFNHDGKPDLLCHFDASRAGFQQGDSNGTVTGMTNSGDAFKGTGFLKVFTGSRDWKRDLDRERHGHHR